MGGIPIGVTLFNMQMQRKHSQTSKSRRSWEIVRLKLPLADTQTKAQVGTITTVCSCHLFLWNSRATAWTMQSPPNPQDFPLILHVHCPKILNSSTSAPLLRPSAAWPLSEDAIGLCLGKWVMSHHVLSCRLSLTLRSFMPPAPIHISYRFQSVFLRNRETFQVSPECLWMQHSLLRVSVTSDDGIQRQEWCSETDTPAVAKTDWLMMMMILAVQNWRGSAASCEWQRRWKGVLWDTQSATFLFWRQFVSSDTLPFFRFALSVCR